MKKRNCDMLERIASTDNLLRAWRVVKSNTPRYRRMRSSGPDGISLAEFENNLTAEILALRESLLGGYYEPQKPRSSVILKKGGGKREISILPIQERVAQRAVFQVIEPLWEPEFLDCSFGFRPGLSVKNALDCAQQFRMQDNRWVVDSDIADCFGRLNHDLLMLRLKRKINDGRVLDLMQAWLDAGVLQAGPPVDSSEDIANWVDRASSFLKFSSAWALDAYAEEINPYAAARYGTDASFSDKYPSYTLDRDELVSDTRSKALKKMVFSGLLWSASWARPAFAWMRDTAITNINTPAGRRLIKKGAMTTGSLAGVAAAAAITTYLLQRKAGPAPTGVLQGSPISPLLANIYLHPFDRMMLRRHHCLVRYADDWLILCPSREAAELAYNDAVVYLARLYLKINRDKTHIRAPDEPFEWLGVVVK